MLSICYRRSLSRGSRIVDYNSDALFWTATSTRKYVLTYVGKVPSITTLKYTVAPRDCMWVWVKLVEPRMAAAQLVAWSTIAGTTPPARPILVCGPQYYPVTSSSIMIQTIWPRHWQRLATVSPWSSVILHDGMLESQPRATALHYAGAKEDESNTVPLGMIHPPPPPSHHITERTIPTLAAQNYWRQLQKSSIPLALRRKTDVLVDPASLEARRKRHAQTRRGSCRQEQHEHAGGASTAAAAAPLENRATRQFTAIHRLADRCSCSLFAVPDQLYL